MHMRGIGAAVERGDEADEAFGGMVASMDMPLHAAPAGSDAGTASRLVRGVRLTRAGAHGTD